MASDYSRTDKFHDMYGIFFDAMSDVKKLPNSTPIQSLTQLRLESLHLLWFLGLI